MFGAYRPPSPPELRLLQDVQDVPQRSVRISSLINISCHCGRVSYSLNQLPMSAFGPENKIVVDLCHTARARKSSGQMVTSYFPIFKPDMVVLARTSATHCTIFGGEVVGTLFFCPCCGCHMFRKSCATVAGMLPGLQALGRVWGVASGTATMDRETASMFTIGRHRGVCETGDGGLSIWMREKKDGSRMLTDLPEQNPDEPWTGYVRWLSPDVPPSPTFVDSGRDILRASCACGTVRFHITRPGRRSYLPKSQYPDLIVPYHLRPRVVSRNPLDDKWWIRPPREIGYGGPDDGYEPDEYMKRYLAGNCACTSCRKTSGFEIQSWAFIPRCNIVIDLPDGTTIQNLNFNELPPDVLRCYPSSPGVLREFCPSCGATAFWHNHDRPDLIDVSVALFDGRGVRAADWLDWWKERVSFAEMSREAHGGGLMWDPVGCLETGLADAAIGTDAMRDMRVTVRDEEEACRRGIIRRGGVKKVVL